MLYQIQTRCAGVLENWYN